MLWTDVSCMTYLIKFYLVEENYCKQCNNFEILNVVVNMVGLNLLSIQL
jgi:hypothetical protein